MTPYESAQRVETMEAVERPSRGAFPAATFLRPARLDDVPAMAALINGYAARELMLPKSEGELYRSLREYLVQTEPGGELLACGGLRVYSPALAEIVGLAVRESMHGRGLGAGIVRRLVAEAEELGIGRLFAMTLDEGFFHRLGFRTTTLADIPEKVRADCRSCARRAGCREIAVVRELPPLGVLTKYRSNA